VSYRALIRCRCMTAAGGIRRSSRRTRRHALLVSTSLLLSGVVSAARAAEAGQPTPAAEQAGSPAVTEVVVTARKKTERLIDVPVSVTALDHTALNTYATTSLQSIGDLIPGVELLRTGGATSGANFSIRGVGNLAIDFGNEQPVALVVDGMPFTRGRIADLGFFDVSNVEVLKGPQALFFGKNSPAGVVSLDSVSPGQKFEGYLQTGYEFNAKEIRLEGAISIPVNDTLSVRVAGQHTDAADGLYRNYARPIQDPFPNETSLVLPGAQAPTTGAGDSDLLRVTVAWRPTDRFDATLRVAGAHTHVDSTLSNQTIVHCGAAGGPTTRDLLDPTIAFQDPFSPCSRAFGDSQGALPVQLAQNTNGFPSNGKPFDSTDTFFSTLNMTYRLPNLTLTSVTGGYYADHRDFDSGYEDSVYAQGVAATKEKTGIFTQEVRLASQFSGSFQFTAGTYYEHTNRDLNYTNLLFPLGPFSGPGLYHGKWNTTALFARNSSDSESVFAQISWKILPELELSGGARYSHDSKLTHIGYTYSELYEFVGPTANFATPGDVYDPKTDESNVSPEVTLTWHPERNVTLYGAYKTGYLAGGAANPGVISNYKLTNPSDPNSALAYNAETVKGGEVGAKGSFLNGRLTADLTLYRYDYTNLQVQVFDPITTSFTIQNAASSRSQGVDAEARYQMTSALQVHGSLVYTDLRYVKYPNASCYVGEPASQCVGGETQDLSGSRYGGAPLTINYGGVFDRAVVGNYHVGISADAYFTSKTPPYLLEPVAVQGAVTIVDAAIRFYPAEGPWEISLIGKNLGNALRLVGFLDKPYGVAGDVTGTIGNPPRQITLQATYRF
jgi:iron complex outermembrane recepter protein